MMIMLTLVVVWSYDANVDFKKVNVTEQLQKIPNNQNVWLWGTKKIVNNDKQWKGFVMETKKITRQ